MYQNQSYNTSYQPFRDEVPTYYSPPSEIPQAYVPNNDGKFPEPRQSTYRDVLFSILFVFHLVAVTVLSIVGSIKNNQGADAVYTDNENIVPPLGRPFERVILVCTGAAAFGGVLSFIWIAAIKRFARQLIFATMICSTLMSLGFAIILMVQGQLIASIIMFVATFINILCFIWWRNRIPFATQMLETVSARIQDYPATTYIAYVCLFLQIGWTFAWVYSAIVTQNFAQTKTLAWIYAVFMILSFYWTSQVIKNVVHVTAAGTFATWYFLHGTVGVPTHPTLRALKRSLTTSFGSICLGSLIVAALKTLRTIVQSLRTERNQLLTCIADMLIGCLDNLLNYFNLYAYTQVAIYGKSYCQAAKDTWRLIQSHGIEAIINDNLISNVLLMGAVLGGVICAFFSAVLSSQIIHDYWMTCTVLGFLIGFAMCMTTMEIVESGVACIFVCFAMDPLALKRNDANLYRKFQETYSGVLHDV